MMRYCFGSLLFLGIFMGSASAQVQCNGPFLPVVPDGATATEAQMNTIREQVEAFMRDSEDYQNCLLTILRQAEAEAARDPDEVLEPAVRRRTIARVNANQNHKIRVSDEFNAAARAHNEANPLEGAPGDPAANASPES